MTTTTHNHEYEDDTERCVICDTCLHCANGQHDYATDENNIDRCECCETKPPVPRTMTYDTNSIDRVFYWSDIAELTHATQVENFGFCTCEDGPKVYDDCEAGDL